MAADTPKLEGVTVTANAPQTIKKPIAGPPILNPLHEYASSTYSWSLWWLDVSDYNSLIRVNDPNEATNYRLSSKSFVVAEDAGRYPDRRQPGTLGLNYHIQEVMIKTHLAHNSTTKSSNLLSGTITILEPYGITFIDTLIAASLDPNSNRFNNYLEQPFLLEVEFRGYDDKGDPVPESEIALYRKKFPIRIIKIDAKLSTKGAEYRLTIAPMGHKGYDDELGKTPVNFTITAGTVKEFFDELSIQYQYYFSGQVVANQADYADAIKFDIDPTIAGSKIFDETSEPLTKVNPKSKSIDLTKNTFNIPRGTPILDVITRVMAHSEYLIDQLVGLEGYADSDEIFKNQNNIFNAFKIATSTEFSGQIIDINLGATGTTAAGVFDYRRNVRPRTVTHKIYQYPSWKAEHPNLPLLPDGTPHIIKNYNYIYTGQNTDIVDFKLNFNTTYYNAVLAYTSAIAAASTTESTGEDRAVAGVSYTSTKLPSTARLMLNPAIFSKFDPRYGLVATPTPPRWRMVSENKNVTTGIDVYRPEAQIAADVLKSLYSNLGGDMLSLQLTIVGDPTLIKQDDWLYIPSPVFDTDYNKWDTVSQYEFCKKYGHIRTDVGELVVGVTLYSPVDVDLDISNQGHVFPAPNTDLSVSTFSGLYRILTIENRFSQGKFQQTLNLARYINSDYAKTASGSSDANRNDSVRKGVGADSSLSNENGVTPGEQYPQDDQGRGIY